MPPFQNRSTGALRIAFISSAGVNASTVSGRPSAARASGDTGTDFSVRAKTPPPAEMRL
jgi:hypothetical protein